MQVVLLICTCFSVGWSVVCLSVSVQFVLFA